MTDGRLRLTILGGFLGSGKTTWLRHHLFEDRFKGAHVLVNEAAGTPVDHSLLGRAEAMTVLAGGCACCDGQGAFRDALVSICDARSKTPRTAPEQLVLETSGLADPAAIIDLIQTHPILVRHIVVTEVIVIVDALYGLASLEAERLACQQIGTANRLVITKTDRASERDMARLRLALRHLAPAASQEGSAFGSATALPAIADGHSDALPRFAAGTGAAITVSQLDLGAAPDWTALSLWLSALLHARGDEIVRVKGVVTTPAGRLLLQAVRKTVQSPEILPISEASPIENQVVLIGRNMDQDALRRSFEHVSGVQAS